MALAAAQRKVAEVEDGLASLAAQRQASLALRPDAPVEARVAARTWADALTEQAVRMERQQQVLQTEAESRRRDLAKAASERRAVEKLRERAWADYQAELGRFEQAALDETASGRHEFARRQAQQR